MGQYEILEYLIMLRKTGDDKFYSMVEINKMMGNEQIRATCFKINRLYAHGFLEIKVENWKRYFRGKVNGME